MVTHMQPENTTHHTFSQLTLNARIDILSISCATLQTNVKFRALCLMAEHHTKSQIQRSMAHLNSILLLWIPKLKLTILRGKLLEGYFVVYGRLFALSSHRHYKYAL